MSHIVLSDLRALQLIGSLHSVNALLLVVDTALNGLVSMKFHKFKTQ